MPGRDAHLRSTGAAPSLDDLSRAALAGHESALAQLHARLTPGLVRHFTRKLGPGAGPASDEADELAQRTWIALWEAIRDRKYDPSKARLTTFLYAVSHVVWMRHRRDRQRLSPDSGARFEPESDLAASPPSATFLAGELERVRQVLSGSTSTGLTEADRQVLRGIADGRTDRELAEQMGLSASTAHGRKKAALAKLSQVLREREIGEDTGRAPPRVGA